MKSRPNAGAATKGGRLDSVALACAVRVGEVAISALGYEDLIAGIESVLREVIGVPVSLGIAARAQPDRLELVAGSHGLVGGPGAVLPLSPHLSRIDLPDGFGTMFITSSLPLDDDGKETIAVIAPLVAAAINRLRSTRTEARTVAAATVLAEVAEGILAGRAWPQLPIGLLTRFCELSGAFALAIVSTGAAMPQVLVSVGQLSDNDREQLTAGQASAAPAGDVLVDEIRGAAGDTAGLSRVRIPVVVTGRRVAEVILLRSDAGPLSPGDLQNARRLGRLVALGRGAEGRRREQEVAARTDERQRIADHLHDEVAQVLFSAEVALRSAIDDLGPDAIEAKDTVRAHELLVRGQIQLRDWMHKLGASASTGWAERLAAVAHEVEEEFSVAIRVRLPESELPALSDSLAGALLRAVREGLINAAKHAQPCRIELTVRIEDAELLEVTVTDDGAAGPSGGIVGHGLASVRRLLVGVGGTVRLDRDRTTTRYAVTIPILPAGM